MKVSSYKVPSSEVNQYKSEAKLRGYDQAVSQEYIKDRKRVYKQHAPAGNVIWVGSLVLLAGKIASNVKEAKISCFVDAAKKQFQPLRKALTYCNLRELEEKTKIFNTKQPSIIKMAGNGIKNGARLAYRGLEGVWNSIPNKIKWPALFFLTFIEMSSIMEKNKVDAKCDTLQFIKNHNAKNC